MMDRKTYLSLEEDPKEKYREDARSRDKQRRDYFQERLEEERASVSILTKRIYKKAGAPDCFGLMMSRPHDWHYTSHRMFLEFDSFANFQNKEQEADKLLEEVTVEMLENAKKTLASQEQFILCVDCKVFDRCSIISGFRGGIE
jgi:hypothetical protein